MHINVDGFFSHEANTFLEAPLMSPWRIWIAFVIANRNLNCSIVVKGASLISSLDLAGAKFASRKTLCGYQDRKSVV